MGYNTMFNFSILEGCEEGREFEIIEKFRNYSECAEYAFDSDGECEECLKWYDYKSELTSFSKKHPDFIFLLEGVGEEVGDAWKLYVKDGHSQDCRAELVYPEFDRGKLLSEIREKVIVKVLK